MKSIKTKLVVYFSLLILISSVSIGFVSILKSRAALTEQAENSLQVSAYEGAKLVDARIKDQQSSLQIVANRSDVASMEWDKQQPLINRLLSQTEFLAFGISDLKGNIQFHDGSTLNIGDEQYFKDVLDDGKATVSLSRHSITNEPEVRYLVPIKNGSKIVGVLLGIRDGYNLSDIIEGIGFGQNGYSYILNGKGTTIAHPDKSIIESETNVRENAKSDDKYKSLALAVDEVLKSENDTSEYSYNDKDYYIGYSNIPDTDWHIVITAEQKEVLAAIPSMVNSILLISSMILLVSIAFIYIIGNSIAKPIIKVKNYSEKLADLDITNDVEPKLLNQKDEIGVLANSTQSVILNLREIISEISESSNSVASSSEELTATSQQASAAVEQVAIAIDEVASGASDQAENTQIGSSKVDQLGEIIEDDQINIGDVNIATKKLHRLLNLD